MIAKLRVGWMVAGCAPGVRTITSRFLFHCTTWFTDEPGEPGIFLPRSEAAYDWLAWAVRTAPRTASAIHIFFIERSPLCRQRDRDLLDDRDFHLHVAVAGAAVVIADDGEVAGGVRRDGDVL